MSVGIWKLPKSQKKKTKSLVSPPPKGDCSLYCTYVIQRGFSFAGFVLQNRDHSSHAHFVTQVFFLFGKYWEHAARFSWLHSVL